MRPTYLKHKELYEYDSCAAFVADYLTYEPLQVPNELVSKRTKMITIDGELCNANQYLSS